MLKLMTSILADAVVLCRHVTCQAVLQQQAACHAVVSKPFQASTPCLHRVRHTSRTYIRDWIKHKQHMHIPTPDIAVLCHSINHVTNDLCLTVYK